MEIEKIFLETEQNQVDQTTLLMDAIIKNVIGDECAQLDDLVQKVQTALEDSSSLVDSELDTLALKIPTLMYPLGTFLEAVGVKEDVAKLNKNEQYNTALQTAAGTVDAKKGIAENESLNASLIWTAYQRAYKIIKGKLDCASEVLQSVKKVINHRISELTLSQRYSGAIIEEDDTRRFQ